MKRITALLLFVAVFSFAQKPEVKLLRLSQYATVSQTVGVTDMSISYHRPGVKGREIFGKLEQFGKVWRAGANNATSFEFSQDVTIAGTTLKAGRYEFFLIPTENEWTVIFNSAKDQWGAYSYDSTLNVVTFQIKPETIAHEEWLSYSFSDLTISSAKVSLKWDKTAISFVISTNTEENVKKLETQYYTLAAQQAGTFARYSLDSKSDFDKGIAAADRAITIAPNFPNLSFKAGKASNANTGNFEKTVAGWKEKFPPAKGKKK